MGAYLFLDIVPDYGINVITFKTFFAYAQNDRRAGAQNDKGD